MAACCTPDTTGRHSSQDGRATAVVARGAAVTPHLVTIPAATFRMGNDGPDAVPGDGEGPVRSVTLSTFAIAPGTVTNRAFSEFVRATRYVTDAEQAGLSFVFYLQVAEDVRRASRQVASGLPWWLAVEYASWQRPEGPGSHILEQLDHPVVHVSCNDAQAYCAWAGVRLPTEAEWECAARGGLDGRRYPWGDDLSDGDRVDCNIFHGTFPNQPRDGWHPGTVTALGAAPNAFGLHNTCGNVWEWCADWHHADYHRMTAPQNPLQDEPTGRRSIRGGSFLCHDSYCNRYRVAARHSSPPSSAASNIGFRVAR